MLKKLYLISVLFFIVLTFVFVFNQTSAASISGLRHHCQNRKPGNMKRVLPIKKIEGIILAQAVQDLRSLFSGKANIAQNNETGQHKSCKRVWFRLFGLFFIT